MEGLVDLLKEKSEREKGAGKRAEKREQERGMLLHGASLAAFPA